MPVSVVGIDLSNAIFGWEYIPEIMTISSFLITETTNS